MNRKLLSAALALSLAAALALPVAAEGLPDGASLYSRDQLLIAPNPTAALSKNYNGIVSVNGEEVLSVNYGKTDPETLEMVDRIIAIGDLPGAPAGYVPMTLLCQADPKGYAAWIPEENSSVFAFNGNSFIVWFDDMSVEVMGEKAEGVTAYLAPMGVTYLPASFLATLEDVEVETYTFDGQEVFDFTLKSDPLQALTETIRTETEMAMGEAVVLEYAEALGFDPATTVALAGYMPMMVTPDTVIIAQVSEGGMDAAKAAMEAYVQSKEETFSWYLTQHLYKVEDARIVEQGDYIMLFIGDNGDLAQELFRTGIAALTGTKAPR